MNRSSYLGWIANFGVEPLLAVFAFRRFPDRDFLASRRLLVIRVLETISILPVHIGKNLLNILTSRPNVKMIVLLITSLGLNYGVFAESGELNGVSHEVFSTAQGLGAENLERPEKDEKKALYLATGEVIEFPTQNMSHFSIGNKEVISVKVQAQKLLIKGVKQGHSEFSLWQKSGKKDYQFFVLAKNHHLKFARLMEAIESLGLKSQIRANLLMVEGEIQEAATYQQLRKLFLQEEDKILSKISLHPKLRNEIVAHIYQDFFKLEGDSITCVEEGHLIVCDAQLAPERRDYFIKNLQKKYFVDFRFFPRISGENFLIKLKLVQMENGEGKEFSFGLNALSGTIGELFTSGLKPIIYRNQWFLKQHEVDISTLAEPETVILLDQKATIQMGADIPYLVPSSIQGPETQSWKFAGLKVELELKKVDHKYQVTYKTEFTKPDTSSGSGTITGSKEESTVFLDLGRVVQIFQIAYHAKGVHSELFPVIGQIPLLGQLFHSKGKSQSYKKIQGFIQIERYDQSLSL
jgi:hypothetical protein